MAKRKPVGAAKFLRTGAKAKAAAKAASAGARKARSSERKRRIGGIMGGAARGVGYGERAAQRLMRRLTPAGKGDPTRGPKAVGRLAGVGPRGGKARKTAKRR